MSVVQLAPTRDVLTTLMRDALGVARVRGARSGAARGSVAVARSAAELDPSPRVRAWARYALGATRQRGRAAARSFEPYTAPLATSTIGDAHGDSCRSVQRDKNFSLSRLPRRARRRASPISRAAASRCPRFCSRSRTACSIPLAIWSGGRRERRRRDATTRRRTASPRSSPSCVLVLYLVTMAPSTAMWDTSEYIAAAYTFGLPHPPGNPFFVIIGRVFSLLPIAPTRRRAHQRARRGLQRGRRRRVVPRHRACAARVACRSGGSGSPAARSRR